MWLACPGVHFEAFRVGPGQAVVSVIGSNATAAVVLQLSASAA